jgi:peptidoglycan/xylan/chitin deacetylase (PgdA/CDA1 family)
MWKPVILCTLAATCLALLIGAAPSTTRSSMNDSYTYDHGGVIRGDSSKKQIALIFTGGDFGEGAPHILDTLKKLNIKASMFVTGDFLRHPELVPQVKRMVAEGHYVGPHSDKHPLYCPWEDRSKTLITEKDFRDDLSKNIADLRALGALSDPGPIYFIPPFEWFNQDQVKWANDMNVLLFNFTPGSGSNRDYMPESEKRFVSSQKIMDDVLAYEQKDPNGLNGYLLLLHLGADRKDKMFLLLEPLVKQLQSRGYSFVRLDEMIKP